MFLKNYSYIKIVLIISVIILIIYEVFFNQLMIKYYTGGIKFILANNNTNMKNLYFIHIPKNMGTLIHYNLPQKYNRKYYSCGLINNTYYLTTRDHILINDMIKIDPSIINMPIIAIIREPIDRFISICNYFNFNPKNTIENCILFKNETKPTLRNYFNMFIPQVNFIKSDKKLNIDLFTIENREGIINWFKSRNVILDLDVKMNTSYKKYKKEDLTKYQIDFLTQFYKEDTDLYNSLKNNQSD